MRSSAPAVASICVLPRCDFDWSGLAASASMPAVALVEDVPVGHLTSAIAALRLHTATMPTGSWVRLELCAVAPTSEDPALTFKGPIVAMFEILAGTSAPTMYLSPLGGRSGTHVSLYLYGKQGSGGGTFKFALSMDLRPIEGGTAWSPADLGAKLRLWLDARDQVLVSGAVSDWGDQSSANNDFAQGTAGARPTSGQAVNQEPAPLFDGTDDYLASNALSAFVQASAYHAFVVVRVKTVSANSQTSYFNNPVIADGGAGWWGLFLRNNAGTLQTLAFHWDTSTGERVAVASGIELLVDTLIELSFDGSTIRCQVGGGTVATVSATNVGGLAEAVKIGTGATGAPYFDGRVATAIVCNAYLTSDERAAARAYLSSRYGVPA